MTIVQVILYFLIPIGLELIARRVPFIHKIGVVTLCYILGLVLGNLPFFNIDTPAAQTIIEAVVVLAIPLLLFKTDFRLVRSAGAGMSLAFGCCVVSVVAASLAVTLLFGSRLEHAHVLGGMMTGVYTGGTLNMSAIGVALGAPEDLFVLLNAADMFYGGILLLFFLTISFKVFSKFLRINPLRNSDVTTELLTDRLDIRQTGLAVLLGLGIVAIAIGMSFLVFNGMHAILILLTVTTLGLFAALSPRIHHLKGSYVTGNYLLYVFCVAVGSLADVDQMLTSGPLILAYFGMVLVCTLVLYLALTRIARIDADSAIIASVAGLYGPAFIPPVARATGSMYLVALGIAFSLIGFAIGNYLGIAVAETIEVLMQGME